MAAPRRLHHCPGTEGDGITPITAAMDGGAPRRRRCGACRPSGPSDASPTRRRRRLVDGDDATRAARGGRLLYTAVVGRPAPADSDPEAQRALLAQRNLARGDHDVSDDARDDESEDEVLPFYDGGGDAEAAASGSAQKDAAAQRGGAPGAPAAGAATAAAATGAAAGQEGAGAPGTRNGSSTRINVRLWS